MMEDLDNVVDILKSSNHAIALTGAGISTDSNIPDYRGPNGVWTKDPEAERRAYEAYRTFVDDPVGYWKGGYGKHILLDAFKQAMPNRGHIALSDLEHKGYLKCTITQNIDGLHRKAGSTRLIEYHGNAMRLRCLRCNHRYELKDIDVPRCDNCGAILKSDIVNFGEPIPPDVVRDSLSEVESCDTMLVCGTSAVVYPFAALPHILKEQKGNDSNIIEINLTETELTRNGVSDILLKGNLSDVLTGICNIIRERDI